MKAGAAELRELAALLPPGSVSVAEADRLAASTDLWPRHLVRWYHGRGPELPAAVVWPQSLGDVQAVVEHARRTGMELVPYGAGSSVVGGATPSEGQVVVDLKRLQRVLEIDGEARIARAECGIVGELLERQLNRAGYTQGHFPSSIYCSTLGGWIAARSAGQMSSRYGKIEDQVVGGVVVLGDGSVLRQPASPVRDPRLDELIGSEGTMGLWVEASVRIHPLPQGRELRAFDFPDLDRAVAAARELLFSGLAPCVLRIYDPLDSFLHRGTHTHRREDRGANKLAWVGANLPRLIGWIADRLMRSCRFILGFEGAPEVAAAEMTLARTIAAAHGARDLGPGGGEAWYATRYAISYRQSNAFRAGVAVDTMEVACPWERVRPVYDAVRRAGLGVGAQVLAHFSHVYLEGCSIYFTYALPARGGEAAYDRLWTAALAAAVGAGANVSHHHGSGRLKASAVAQSLGGARSAVRELRSTYDPDGILNPDVLRGAGQETSAGPPRAAAPPPRGFVCVADPDTPLRALEADLRAGGRTLGASARLFGDLSVVEAARADRLWRRNPQLRVVERMVWGVDGAIDGIAHQFIPGPRAAVGPDLVRALLDGDVERLWLRTGPVPGVRHVFAGETGEVLEACADLCGNPLTAAVAVAVDIRESEARIEIELAADVRAPLAEAEIERRMRYGCLPVAEGHGEGDAGESTPMPSDASFVAGPWKALQRFARDPALKGMRLVLPWSDPVGAAGFVTGGGAPERARVAQAALAHGVGGGALIEERGDERTTGGRPRTADGSGDGRTTGGRPRTADGSDDERTVSAGAGIRFAHLRLIEHEGALDNCTYCPKLCRFSCPVAVADGSETLTPRQLMLTAALDRSDKRRLEPDVAARLWSCTDCGGCASFCEHGNDVAAVLADARAELSGSDGMPPAVRRYLDELREHGRPPDRPSDDDAGVLLQDRGDRDDAETWLFLGCQTGREELEAAAATLALCRATFGRTHVLAGPVGCCGHPLWRWGDREGFAAHARAFVAQLGSARRLVVDDPGCAMALRDLYDEVGVVVPDVVTTLDLLGGVALSAHPEGPWTVHDACMARRIGAPGLRASVTAEANGHAGREEEERRDGARDSGPGLVLGSVLEGEAGCCGGMLIATYDEALAARVGEAAARDLLGGGAERVVSSSPTCRRRLRAAGVEALAPVMLWDGMPPAAAGPRRLV